MDECDAIRLTKQKDPNGLKWLFDRYYSRALQVAFLITGDLPTAEDVVQEKFLDLNRSIFQFDEKRPFSPWFMRSVMNLAVQTARRSKRQVPFITEGDPDLFEHIELDDASPEDCAISAEIKQRVWNALNQLSPRQKAVVIQRYFLDLSEKEMGGEMAIAPGTVKWLLNAARNKLRVLLEHERSDK